MILKALKYTRFDGESREWKITGVSADGEQTYVEFENLNLFVGKNSSGKSRTLTVIKEIANLISNKITVGDTACASERYELLLEENDVVYDYKLNFKKREIISETLSVGGKEILNREKGVVFDLRKNEAVRIFVDSPSQQLISLVDGDGKPYFGEVVEWGDALSNYLFVNQYEKNTYVKDYAVIEDNENSYDGTPKLIYNFYKGREDFGKPFVDEIMKCMHQIGYPISDVSIAESKKGFCLSVEEDGAYVVNQRDMSQGMFRALALFIQMSYAQMRGLSVCMLFDDMGEGLDYDRAKELIGIVIKKINDSEMQFFMTSNDRHIMNKIPLRYWIVIDRFSSKSIFYTYNNSTDVYEDFKYTGLNNFDFLATDFYKNGFGDDVDAELEQED